MINKIKPFVSLVFGLLLIAIGVLCFIRGPIVIRVAIYMLSIYMIVEGAWGIAYSIVKRKDKFLKSIIDLVFGILIICMNRYILQGIAYIALLYLFAMTLINLITFIIYKQNDVDRSGALFNVLLNMVFFFILVFNPSFRVSTILLVIGIYLIILGARNVFLFFIDILPIKYSSVIKGIISIPVPLLMGASLTRKIQTYYDYREVKSKKKPNFYILIHSSDNKKDMFGHIELAINGKIYSYGNYNRHSRRLFEIFGDGIICVANKDKYIKYCTDVRNKHIAEFGICLTKEQKKIVEEQLEKLVNENTVNYFPDAKLAELGLLGKRLYRDFSSELYLYADAKFKKVIKGRNKVFFLAMNNCTLFSRKILESVGDNVLIVNGVSAPGIYFDYLNNKYQIKDSNVVSRKIYGKRVDGNE